MAANKTNRSNIKRQLKVFRRIVVTIFLLGIAMMMVLVFGFMEDQIEGSGVVTGIRDYYIKSLVSARTAKILHHEGEEVFRGRPIVEFDSRDQLDKIELVKNEVKELELEISAKVRAIELLRQDPLPEYYRHTKIALDEAESKFERSEKELEIYSRLYEQQVISRREILRVETEHLANKTTVIRLRDDWRKLQDGMAKQIIAKAEDELALLRQRHENKKVELDLEAKRLEDYIIYSPDTGIITEIPPRPGGYFEKGEVVVKFTANHNKKVVGLVNEKQVFKVEKGQKVRIASNQYNHFDYGYFYGEVVEIYQLPESINGVNYYPVKIILIHEPYPLRFGSSCKITIIAGHERIIFALLGFRSQEYWRRRSFNNQ